QITYAGTVSRSFAEGSELLERLAEVSVSAKQVERVARRIGTERVAERDGAVAAYQALPLAEKFAVPAGVSPPDLAVVMAGSGRRSSGSDRGAAHRSHLPAAAGGAAQGAGLTPDVAAVRASAGGGGLGVGLPGGGAEGVRGRRLGEPLARAAALLRVLRADLGFHPCLVVRVRGGDGGAAACRRLGLLPAVDCLGLAGAGDAGAQGPGGTPGRTGAAGAGRTRDQPAAGRGPDGDLPAEPAGQDAL